MSKRKIRIKNVSIIGQMLTCAECGLEYFAEDAEKERWYLHGGHCKKCGLEKLSLNIKNQ
jgi:predicted Zn-ribbon and HTH transcriptional regulator